MNFLTMYDNYFDDVYRYVFFKTGSRWDTDDLVSDIFRKAFEKQGSVRKNHKAWLFTIARNTVTDHYRRKKDLTMSDELDFFVYPGSFEEDLEKRDEVNCLKKSLQALSNEELEMVNLRFFSEMKHREIGELLCKTENAVKLKFLRILEKLRILVKNCVEGS